ncbi:MAG: PDZ domain-containing protein [Chloroflexi bacterium]|nr:PDZ domain-containing protein [Chloroflexota bacterium]
MRRYVIALVIAVLLVGVPVAIAFGKPVLPGFAQQESATPTPTATPGPASTTTKEPKPWVGLLLGGLNERLAQRLELDRNSGVVVLGVVPESPAAAAGIQSKDIILAVADQQVSKVNDVQKAVKAVEPGASLSFRILRGKDESVLTVKVGQRPAGPEHPKGPPQGVQHPPLPQARLPFQNNLARADLTLLDKDNKPHTLNLLAGEVSAVGQGSLTIKPRDGSASQTVTVGTDVVVRKAGKKIELSEVAVGDMVVLVSKDGVLRTVLVKPLFPTRSPAGRFPHRHMTGALDNMMGATGEMPGLEEMLGNMGLPGVRSAPSENGGGWKMEMKGHPGRNGDMKGKMQHRQDGVQQKRDTSQPPVTTLPTQSQPL